MLVPLALLLILWLYVFYAEGGTKHGPTGVAFGADWAMFVGAAQIVHDGGDPYRPSALYAVERRMLHRQGLPITHRRAVVRVGNPPLFFWALQPFTRARFQAGAAAGMIGLYLLSAIGFLATLLHLGWKRRLLPTLLFLMMPQVIIGAFYGNVIGLVFAGIGVSLALSVRFPVAAGAVLSVAWLKPPVALPLVMLIALFHVSHRRKFLSGFSGASASLFLLTLLVTGWRSMLQWIGGLIGYSRDMAIQPDVASLAGLYVRWMPAPSRIMLEALSLALAIGLTAIYWHRRRDNLPSDFVRDSWLWFVWMLATPYAHFFDEMLLAVPVLALLGKDGYRVTRPLPIVALYLMFFSLFFLSWTPLNMYLLPLPLIAVGLCVALVDRHPAHSQPMRVVPVGRS